MGPLGPAAITASSRQARRFAGAQGSARHEHRDIRPSPTVGLDSSGSAPSDRRPGQNLVGSEAIATARLMDRLGWGFGDDTKGCRRNDADRAGQRLVDAHFARTGLMVVIETGAKWGGAAARLQRSASTARVRRGPPRAIERRWRRAEQEKLQRSALHLCRSSRRAERRTCSASSTPAVAEWKAAWRKLGIDGEAVPASTSSAAVQAWQRIFRYAQPGSTWF